MKVLFVISGNSRDFKIAPFVKAQGESLKAAGVGVEYFPITGKGIRGYIRGGLELRRFLKDKKFDIIHAHYVLSGWSAVVGSGKIPVVLSLMGSDAYGEYIGERKVMFSKRYTTALTHLIQPFVKAIICKSKFIESFVYRKKISHVIPNGINISHFNPENVVDREKLGLSYEKKYILFLGESRYTRKNIQLAQDAVALLKGTSVELLNPYPISHEEVPNYINAAHVLIMSSFMEGSSNVIKEAMACNCPVVSTNVGDVAWIVGEIEGCYLTGFDPDDVATKLKMALDFSDKKGKTSGRERIVKLGLDDKTIAQRIIDVYKEVIE
ncbi:MAG: glycosyltransferase [Bacteroidales bacterium]|nr:glycosyltransferase [Bacteroidales bacterium]